MVERTASVKEARVQQDALEPRRLLDQGVDEDGGAVAPADGGGARNGEVVEHRDGVGRLQGKGHGEAVLVVSLAAAAGIEAIGGAAEEAQVDGDERGCVLAVVGKVAEEKVDLVAPPVRVGKCAMEKYDGNSLVRQGVGQARAECGIPDSVAGG